MRLRDGVRDETVADQPEQSNISTFTTTDLPLALGQQSDVHLGRLDTALYAMPHEHAIRAHSRAEGKPDAKRYLIEMHNRFALSRGLPGADAAGRAAGRGIRGAAARARDSSSPFCWCSSTTSSPATGTALGHQNQLPAFLAVWSANLLFACAGTFLLWQMATGGRILSAIAAWIARSPKPSTAKTRNGFSLTEFLEKLRPRNGTATKGKSRGIFPRIIDEYIVREFAGLFVLVLAGFVLLMIVFTFFDLLGDILRNHIGLAVVGEYLLNLTPSMLYQIAPLAVLIAVLVTFSVLNRNSEIIAMKATGISLYRLVIPIVAHCCLSGPQLISLRPVLPAASQPQAGGAAQRDQGPPAADLPAPRRELDLRPKPHPGESGLHLLLRVLRSGHATSSPISRSSSSIPPPSSSRGASLPSARCGTPIPAHGSSRTAGCATSRAPT